MTTGNKPAVRKLALEGGGIDGQVAYTRTSATAWFMLPPQPWFFVAPHFQTALKTATAAQYASLAGRRLHLRGTDRPRDTRQWREAMMRYPAGDTPLAHYEEDLHRTSGRLDKMHLADRINMLGVELHNRKHPEEELSEIGYTLAGPGFEAIPATASEVAWLVRKSVSLGCPVDAPRRPLFYPDGPELGWAGTDIAALAAGAARYGDSFASTVELRPRVDGEVLEPRHVCVSTLSRVERFDQWEPWLAMLTRLPFSVETSVVIDVLTPEKAMSKITRAKRKVEGQFKHYGEMGVTRPPSLDIAGQLVQAIGHDIDRGMEGEATRCDVWVHFATSGATPAEAVERAKHVKRLYAPKVEVEITSDQAMLVDSFIPGEKHPTPTFVRPMKVGTLARAVPTVDTGIGHRVGHYLGYTSFGAARQPVLIDLHHDQEVDNQGGTMLIVGDLGSGKTTVGGKIVYQAVSGGEHTTVFDPGGNFAKYCRLFPADSVHFDLMGAAPGTLSSYGVIPNPLRTNCDDDAKYEQACRSAESLRHTTTVSMLRMLLPSEIAFMIDTFFALDQAASAVGDHITNSAMNVITALYSAKGKLAEHSRNLAKFLQTVSESPIGQLLFQPATNAHLDEIGDPLLTVITASGVTVPKASKKREHWTIEELLNVTAIQQATWLVHRSVHQRPRAERKVTLTDENYIINKVSSGQEMVEDANHQSRAHNQKAIFMSHGAGEFGADAAELLDSGLAGTIKNRKRQQEVLTAFRLPLGVGYEEVLGGLSPDRRPGAPREMIAYIGGRHQKITIDRSDLPAEVIEIMNTTPGGGRSVERSGSFALAS